MRINPAFKIALFTVGCCLFSQANAQVDEPSSITIAPGSSFTVGPGSVVSVPYGDIHVQEGATLVNDGEINIGRDLIVDGSLQTTLGGSADHPNHGKIHVAGDAEYRGSLAIALARGTYFREPQDFTIATYSAGFGTLAARQLPGAKWSSSHRDSALVVSLNGMGDNATEQFHIEVDAAPLEDKVVIDWIAYFDDRSSWYTVERFGEDGTWQALGKVARVPNQTSAAYYSTVDSDLPKGKNLIRYRIRLEDESGNWNYSAEVLVSVGTSPVLRVFPNPVKGPQVRLLGIDTQRELTSLRLLSLEGRKLQSYPVNSQEVYVLELPTETAAGVHVIQVTYADGSQQSAQLVVVK